MYKEQSTLFGERLHALTSFSMDPGRNNFPPSFNFFNSQSGYQDQYGQYAQMYQGQPTPQNNQYPFQYNPSFVPDQRRCESTSSTSSTENTTAATNTKEPASKPSKKYDTWPQQHQKLLVQLWAENHESLESKDSRNTWRKICEELNKRERTQKTVEKCKKKIAYLIDRYKIAKEWNKKQSGGSIRKSLFYDEIDAILGCRDVVTMGKVAEAGSSSSALNSSTSSATDDENESGEAAKKEEKVEENKAKRKERKGKKRRANDSEAEDEERAELSESLKSFKESGQKLGNFMDNFTQVQQQQTTMMSQFLGALTQFMAKANDNQDKSSQ